MKNFGKQQGIGLIEVLVAAIIMAVGILGYAAMQIHTLGEASNAQYRMQALALAGDLVSRIRANPDEKNTYINNSDPYAVAANVASCLVIAQPCSTKQLADWDKSEVATQLRSLLPGASLAITPNNVDKTIIVRIAWNGKQAKKEQCEGLALEAGNKFESNCIALEVSV